jgi:hypothetical protein
MESGSGIEGKTSCMKTQIPTGFSQYIKRTSLRSVEKPSQQQLSLFTQYAIRKLIQDYFFQLRFPLIKRINVQDLYQVDLNRLLDRLHQDKKSQSIRRELETLIPLYQQLSARTNDPCSTLPKIKQRVLQVFGLRLGFVISKALPQLTREESVHQFQFYENRRLQEGIRTEKDLYGLIQSFDKGQCLLAYQLTWVLSEYKVPFVLTESGERYALWVSLRSPTYSVLREPNSKVLRCISRLYTSAYKLKRHKQRDDNLQASLTNMSAATANPLWDLISH